MKRALILSVLLLLSGCAKPVKQPEPRPTGMIKIMEDKDVTTYISMLSVALYQGNPHLRQFYLINNYVKPSLMSEKENLFVRSSRAINVVNCERPERSVFDRVYLSELYGEGKVVAKKDPIGQWQTFPQDSVAGLIQKMVCAIDPALLKDASLKETRKAWMD
ncbi:Uncharacterised protein [Cedecea neteri]|uniref:Surface-adhesin protein E-like domain-containing protein n=1 Tax=Cedecea neteri TaxID=158822 RepID=A0A291E3N7_9ENTR|nr:surface-adhesin E family protein [Cedecea neteri]ATF94670.1 hypothetical protein CO704_22545 [Cedecea neteri]SQA98186.1 Uncharacterised protein [Cedecea neteri]